MKTSTPLMIACAALLLLSSGSARASSWDFFDHDNFSPDEKNYSDKSTSKNDDDDSDWSSKDKNKFGDDDGKGKNYSHSSQSSDWSDGDEGDDKHRTKDGKGDTPPPPQCAAADPGHGKKDGDQGDKDDGGDKDHKKGHGWGDNGGDKDKWGHNYYKNICDKDPGHGQGHHHPCDPGDPVPLPTSLPMFALAVALLVLRKKMFDRSAK